MKKMTTPNTSFTTIDVLKVIYHLVILFDMHVNKNYNFFYIIDYVELRGIDNNHKHLKP